MSRYALIPAAGSGLRMGVDLPKQYLSVLGKPMLYHCLDLFCQNADITKIFVVLSPDDKHFTRYEWPQSEKLCVLYCGGETRAQTVTNGLLAMRDIVHGEDWILVHDAARPCLAEAELQDLIHTLDHDEVGGLLALPVADTIKRSNADSRVIATESREHMWQAQTPQMFRHGLLLKALQAASNQPTDEAQAVEGVGLNPRLVTGSSTNLKITWPADIKLAELILTSRRGAS